MTKRCFCQLEGPGKTTALSILCAVRRAAALLYMQANHCLYLLALEAGTLMLGRYVKQMIVDQSLPWEHAFVREVYFSATARLGPAGAATNYTLNNSSTGTASM